MKDVTREALVALPARREMNPIIVKEIKVSGGLVAGVNLSTATAVTQAVTNIGVLVGGLPG